MTSAINMTGLSIGIACASLGFVFIQHELSYDRFHRESDQIYWLSASIKNKINLSSTPGPLSYQLNEQFSEVTEYFRFENDEILVRSGNEFFKESAHFVDPNFFSFFNFQLLDGSSDQVLSKPNGLVLTEAMAIKYFGRVSPIGKSLRISYQGKDEIFEVTGVAANPPANSSLQYTFLAPLSFLYQDDPEVLVSKWDNFPMTSFVRIRDKQDLNSLREKLPAFIASNIKIDGMEENSLLFQLRSLEDYHLKDQYLANGLTPPATMTYVRILGIIALLILVVACLNFMNLANAQGSGRLREVGVRRVLGAARPQLIGQLLTESVLMSVFSLGLGIILIEIALPLITEVTGFPLSFNWLTPGVIFPLIGIAIVTGILAGLYPSLLLSRLNAVQTFKSSFKAGGDNLVTKGGLVFQFALSIGLLSCTFVMYQQQQFIKNRNLGFEQEQIVVIPTQTTFQEAAQSRRVVEQYKNEVLANPNVLQAAGVSYSFDRGNAALFVDEEDGSQVPVFFYNIDQDYIPLLDITMAEGSNFNTDSPENPDKSLIVNEAFLRHFGIDQIEEYQLPEKFSDLANARIIGVVKDYHYLNLKSEIRPLILQMKKDAHFGYILVKIGPGKVDETLAQLQSNWQKISPSKPFEFSFLDEDIQRQYLVEARWNKAITGAAVLAILIACLGLFGLIALILSERTKEIGIRKILGASIPDIAWLISRQFVVLVMIAALIAIPIAWWTMQQWLENFAYKIDIPVLLFFLALGVTLIIALLTTGIQSAKAATQNPVDALRYE